MRQPNYFKLIITLVMASWMFSFAAYGQNPDARAKFLLESMFREPSANRDWFAESFSSQVPVSQINAIVGQIKGQFGDLERAEGSGNNWQLLFAKFAVPTQIALDGNGRIVGLFFRPPEARGDLSTEEAVEGLLGAVEGQSSLFVRKRSDVLAANNSQTPMAVGSAFKLQVLSLYEQKVAAQTLNRRDVVALDPANKSLPTGSLQNWPDGTPVTLATVAGLMISQSDNTATDMMIDVVGRKELEALSPRNTPFLKTGEAFKLKAGQSGQQREAFKRSNAAVRADILNTMAIAPLPNAADLLAEPTLEIEWYFTTQELCDLAQSLIDAPAMQLSSGPVSPDGWNGVAFKGGSEFGVFNLTAAGRYSDGQTACISFTVNSGEQIANQNELAFKFGAAFASLAEK